MAKSPRTSSLDCLPNTVLYGIVEALCPHCTPDPQRGPYHWVTDGLYPLPDARISSLAAFARTYRNLNDLPTPALYHEPTPSLALIRTLAEKPELGRHAINLYCDDFIFINRPTPDGFTTVDVEIQNMLPELRNLGELLKHKDSEFLMQGLLLSMCPNLEDVNVSIGTEALFSFSDPGSLPRLRRL